MHKLISLLTVSMMVTFAVENCEAVPYKRAKRQNIQGLVIPREFQNLNIENYLKNPRAVQFQLKCLIYDGPCDSIGKYLKANFPNWLSTQCRNCNAHQKKQAGKAIAFFQKNYPQEWMDGVKKYRGTFTEEDVRRFESELGITVESTLPAGGPPKPDTAGLAALAGEAIAAAKTTPEPLIFESRTAEQSSSTTNPITTTTTEAPKVTSLVQIANKETATETSTASTDETTGNPESATGSPMI